MFIPYFTIYWLWVQIATLLLICFVYCSFFVLNKHISNLFILSNHRNCFDFAHFGVGIRSLAKYMIKRILRVHCRRFGHVFQSILQINTYFHFKMHRIPYNKSSNTMNRSLEGIKIKICFACFFCSSTTLLFTPFA